MFRDPHVRHGMRLTTYNNLPRCSCRVPWDGLWAATQSNARLAQLDRALASGAKGQRFESSIARHFFLPV